MDFAISTFKMFLNRVDQRVAMAHELIDMDHDFSIDEQIPIEPDVIQYPGNDGEARDRMQANQVHVTRTGK